MYAGDGPIAVIRDDITGLSETLRSISAPAQCAQFLTVATMSNSTNRRGNISHGSIDTLEAPRVTKPLQNSSEGQHGQGTQTVLRDFAKLGGGCHRWFIDRRQTLRAPHDRDMFRRPPSAVRRADAVIGAVRVPQASERDPRHGCTLPAKCQLSPRHSNLSSKALRRAKRSSDRSQCVGLTMSRSPANGTS